MTMRRNELNSASSTASSSSNPMGSLRIGLLLASPDPSASPRMCEGLERIGWPMTPPKAGMFVWTRIPELFDRMGSMEFFIQMMNRANVALAPGIGFGEEGEGFLRLALVENEHRIRQAIRQMKRAIQAMVDKGVI
jgi:DNA-binding transcriptional MocR family regulator